MTHPFLVPTARANSVPSERPLRAAAPHETARGAADIPDSDALVPWPWDALMRTAGPLLPGSLTIVSARTGSGKTLFIRNWLHWLASLKGPSVAYFPTETPVREVLRGIVCAELGVSPVDVARGNFSRIEGGREAFYDHSLRIARELQDRRSDITGPPLMLFGHPRPNIPLIADTLRRAAQEGCVIAVLDHLLRLDIGDASNPFAEVTSAVRALKMLSEELQLAVVVTSQQNRSAFAGDRLAAYHPPDLAALKGAGTIEEEADLVVFLHRVLRDDLTDSQLTDLRRGKLRLQDAVAPNVMGIAIGKHRLDGSKAGAQERVWVEHGRVRDLPAGERLSWEAWRHGIKSNRDL